jgi:hypothetical protein
MTDEQILFPARQYTLLGGTIVTIKPWGLETGKLLVPRVAKLVEMLQGDYSQASITKVVLETQDEVSEIIRMTLGWDQDQMKAELAYEDLFTLAQAVIDVCIVRFDAEGKPAGALGKLLALAATNRPTPVASREQSSSSSPTDTEKPTS